MKRLRVPAAVLGLVALGTAGYALAASASVSLTADGPQPETVTVNWGDTVCTRTQTAPSTRSGSRAPRSRPVDPAWRHVRARSTKAAAGTTTSSRSAGGTTPGRSSSRSRATSRSRRAPGPSQFGKSVTLSGTSAYPGHPVIVRGRDAGAGGDWKSVLEVVAAEDGSYSGRLRPKVGARYQARAAADQLASKLVDVAVQAQGHDRGLATRRPRGLDAHRDRPDPPGWRGRPSRSVGYDQRRKRWVTLTTRAVAKNGKVVFRVKLEEGANRLKISFRRGSTTAGYTPAESRFVRVLGTKQN